MDTIINPSNDQEEYDIDDGVYFLGSRDKGVRPKESQFHQFIVESVKLGKSNKTI